MRLFLIPMIIWLLLNIGLNFYIFRTLSKHVRHNGLIKWAYAILSVLLLAVIIVALCLPLREGNESILLTVNWLIFTYIAFYVPQYIFFLFDIVSKIPVLLGFARWKWLSITGAFLSIILFLGFWWGALINRFRIDVKEVDVEIAGLPKSFEGYKILQFSDFHTGTYGSDTLFVNHVVEAINALNPDAIMFTGDIVNRRSSELKPHVDVLKNLSAPDGVIAILGNHDYGDYYRWDNAGMKQQNMELLYTLFKKAGWQLLRNETTWLVKGNDSIAVIGVENIGDPPFPIYGSLTSSYPDLADDKIKILLSHNPAHWSDSISGHSDINIPLTLSGHTHAMQISIGRLSPAVFRYKNWGGMYEDKEHQHKLYVNIGLGTVGLPMRLGATPELTLFTLHGK